MTCPHEQLRGRCYHPSLAPWPGNCLDDDTCPGGLGPWGAWRSFVGQYEAQPWGWAIRVPVELSPCYYVVPGREDTDAVGWSP